MFTCKTFTGRNSGRNIAVVAILTGELMQVKQLVSNGVKRRYQCFIRRGMLALVKQKCTINYCTSNATFVC